MRNIRCKQGILWLSIAIILTTQFGCAHKPPIRHPSEQVRSQLGSIGVVSALFIPKVEFLTPAKGVLEGAGTGAAIGGVEMFRGSLYSGGPAGWLLGLILAPVGGLVGSVVGGAMAEPAAKVEKEETTLRNVLTELKIQQTMRDYFLQIAREKTNLLFVVLEEQGPVTPDEEINYCSLSGNGIDAVLEISVLNFGLTGPTGINPPIEFFMNLRLKLIRTIDGEMVYVTTMRYEGKKLKFADWSANNAQSFREEYKRSYLNLSERIVENLFLLYVSHVDSYWSGHKFCGLSPLYPEYKGIGFFTHELRYPKVDSLQPTLQWESFPRQKDKEADKTGLLSKISKVTYDLKIWKIEDDFPTELVYSKQYLTESKHQMEQPLEISTKYFWSMRARFELDGQPRVTKWSYSRVPMLMGEPDPCEFNYVPNRNYFRFITPNK
jgi:hypothetical protein